MFYIRKFFGLTTVTEEGFIWDWDFEFGSWICQHYPWVDNETPHDSRQRCERNYPKHIPIIDRFFSRDII